MVLRGLKFDHTCPNLERIKRRYVYHELLSGNVNWKFMYRILTIVSSITAVDHVGSNHEKYGAAGEALKGSRIFRARWFAGGSRGNSGYAAGGRCSLGSLLRWRNHAVGMRQIGALQEEIKGSRAGASKYKPRIWWIRWARASSYSLGRRTVNRYKWVSALIVPRNAYLYRTINYTCIQELRQMLRIVLGNGL